MDGKCAAKHFNQGLLAQGSPSFLEKFTMNKKTLLYGTLIAGVCLTNGCRTYHGYREYTKTDNNGIENRKLTSQQEYLRQEGDYIQLFSQKNYTYTQKYKNGRYKEFIYSDPINIPQIIGHTLAIVIGTPLVPFALLGQADTMYSYKGNVYFSSKERQIWKILNPFLYMDIKNIAGTETEEISTTITRATESETKTVKIYNKHVNISYAGAPLGTLQVPFTKKELARHVFPYALPEQTKEVTVTANTGSKLTLSINSTIGLTKQERTLWKTIKSEDLEKIFNDRKEILAQLKTWKEQSIISNETETQTTTLIKTKIEKFIREIFLLAYKRGSFDQINFTKEKNDITDLAQKGFISPAVQVELTTSLKKKITEHFNEKISRMEKSNFNIPDFLELNAKFDKFQKDGFFSAKEKDHFIKGVLLDIYKKSSCKNFSDFIQKKRNLKNLTSNKIIISETEDELMRYLKQDANDYLRKLVAETKITKFSTADFTNFKYSIKKFSDAGLISKTEEDKFIISLAPSIIEIFKAETKSASIKKLHYLASKVKKYEDHGFLSKIQGENLRSEILQIAKKEENHLMDLAYPLRKRIPPQKIYKDYKSGYSCIFLNNKRTGTDCSKAIINAKKRKRYFIYHPVLLDLSYFFLETQDSNISFDLDSKAKGIFAWSPKFKDAFLIGVDITEKDVALNDVLARIQSAYPSAMAVLETPFIDPFYYKNPVYMITGTRKYIVLENRDFAICISPQMVFTPKIKEKPATKKENEKFNRKIAEKILKSLAKASTELRSPEQSRKNVSSLIKKHKEILEMRDSPTTAYEKIKRTAEKIILTSRKDSQKRIMYLREQERLEELQYSQEISVSIFNKKLLNELSNEYQKAEREKKQQK